MQEYKESVRKRVGLYVLQMFVLVIAVAISIIVTINQPVEEMNLGFVDGLAEGFRLGILLAISFHVGKTLIKSARALNDEKHLRRLQIEMNDERKKFIDAQVGKKGFEIIIFIVSIATIVAGSLNHTVFLTLIVVWIVVMLTRAGLRAYYSSKY